MYGNSNARNGWMPEGLPRLPTYEKALAHWESVRPYIKGADQGKRPLGEKRRYSRSIIRKVQQLTGADAIVLSYYNNDVVRLYPDGSKRFSTCGYPSISTTHVLNETSATDTLHFSREKGKIYAVYKGTFYCMPDRGHVEVSASGEITGYECESQHTIRFDAMKAKRDKYAPFTTYMRDILTISQHVDENPSTEDMDAVFVDMLREFRYVPALKSNIKAERGVKNSLWAMFDLIDEAMGLEQEEMLKRFYVIAHKFFPSVVIDKCQVNVYKWNMAPDVGNRYVLAEDAVKHFHEVIKYRFADEVFERKDVAPRDRAVHDSNKHYFIFN